MTDEVFTAYDIRGKMEQGVLLETAWNIGKALADWLSTHGSIAILRDHGGDDRLVGAVVEGLRLQGRAVVDHGDGDKLALIAAIQQQGYSGGILIGYDTEQNVSVIELYNEKAQLIGAENGLQEIAELVGAGNFVPAAQKGELTAVA